MTILTQPQKAVFARFACPALARYLQALFTPSANKPAREIVSSRMAAGILRGF